SDQLPEPDLRQEGQGRLAKRRTTLLLQQRVVRSVLPISESTQPKPVRAIRAFEGDNSLSAVEASDAQPNQRQKPAPLILIAVDSELDRALPWQQAAHRGYPGSSWDYLTLTKKLSIRIAAF